MQHSRTIGGITYRKSACSLVIIKRLIYRKVGVCYLISQEVRTVEISVVFRKDLMVAGYRVLVLLGLIAKVTSPF